MENIDDFIQKFKSQYIDGDKIRLSPNSDFRNTGSWDSLTAMAILVWIQDEYRVDIPGEKFRKLTTINEVYNYIIENSN